MHDLPAMDRSGSSRVTVPPGPAGGRDGLQRDHPGGQPSEPFTRSSSAPPTSNSKGSNHLQRPDPHRHRPNTQVGRPGNAALTHPTGHGRHPQVSAARREVGGIRAGAAGGSVSARQRPRKEHGRGRSTRPRPRRSLWSAGSRTSWWCSAPTTTPPRASSPRSRRSDPFPLCPGRLKTLPCRPQRPESTPRPARAASGWHGQSG